MVHIRYSRWDADGRDTLDSESVFDQLNDYMNETGDLQQAMRRLMQRASSSQISRPKASKTCSLR